MQHKITIVLPILINTDNTIAFTILEDTLEQLAAVPVTYRSVGIFNGKYWAIFYRESFPPDRDDLEKLYAPYPLLKKATIDHYGGRLFGVDFS